MALRIAITGSSGYLAQQVIRRLGADPDIEFILGLDIRPRQAEVRCDAAFLAFDLTSPWEELRDLLRKHQINAAMHLAWQFAPIHDAARHRQVDIEGSRNLFRAAEAAAVRRIVYTSSTTAYVNPANSASPPYLGEETAVSGTSRYLYSWHKAEVDRMAQDFLARHSEIAVVILRPCIVLGPNTQNIVSKTLQWPARAFPWIFQTRGADPPMQFVCEEDVAETLYRAVRLPVSGIFNVAGDDVLPFREIVRAAGKKPLYLPAALLYPLAAVLWTLRLAPFPAGMLDMTRYPWVADATRWKQSFGITPRMTSRQALESFLAAHRRS